MKFELTINTENSAFDNGSLGHELARMIHQIACDIESLPVNNISFIDGLDVSIKDINGNIIGTYRHA